MNLFLSSESGPGSSSAQRPSNSHVYSLDNEADGPQTEYINIQDDQNYENVKSPPKRHRSTKHSVQEDPNNTQSYIEVCLSSFMKYDSENSIFAIGDRRPFQTNLDLGKIVKIS